jgi:hypothetical protein
MTYADQWRALSSRIRGLMQAGQLHAHYLAVRRSDPYGRGRRLHEQSESILTALQSFRAAFGKWLPPPALAAVDDFVARNGNLITRKVSGTPDELEERVWAALVLLAAFETEMSFLLSDVQESIRVRSERAFSHLLRSLVVDATLRDKWLTALEAGEVECEKLGAVHLLLHGIWAFKVDAASARTDLVFQEPVFDLARLNVPRRGWFSPSGRRRALKMILYKGSRRRGCRHAATHKAPSQELN